MKYPKAMLAAAIGLACLAGMVAAQETGASGSLARDARDWYEKTYAADFVSGSADFYGHYPEQVQFIRDRTARILSRAEFEAALNEHYVVPWTKAGWRNTRLVSVEASPLGPGTALLAARWQMTDGNGNSVTGCALPGWTYVALRSESTWKIVTEIEGDCQP